MHGIIINYWNIVEIVYVECSVDICENHNFKPKQIAFNQIKTLFRTNCMNRQNFSHFFFNSLSLHSIKPDEIYFNEQLMLHGK